MPNQYGIPNEVEERIRRRDKLCVYCHKIMIYPCVGDKRRDWATIEHFREKGPFYWKDGLKEEDLAICCQRCNSSRGTQRLSFWFTTTYCNSEGRIINQNTVEQPVKDYIRRNSKSF